MEINPSISTTSGTSSSTASANSVLSSDFETFLQMLTAQAEYQDPLEPIDSSEYAAQLAQFSMVEQQVLTNDLLADLNAQLGAGTISELAGWIGLDARTTAPVGFDGNPITLHPDPSPLADEVRLIIRDKDGVAVQQVQIPKSSEPMLWAGVQDDGTPFPAGTYSFEIESLAQGEIIESQPAETYARITEAQLVNGETVLVMAGGVTVGADEIIGLREAPAS